MKTISNVDLEQVTGGKTSNITDQAGSSSNNDQVMGALQGIQSSLKDLQSNQNKGPFGGSNGLLFMTMALALSSRRNSEVYVNYGGGCRRGFYWRSSW